MGPRKTRSQQGVQSIEVGARVLRALAHATRPMMLRDLAAAAQMPPAKAHRYLVSLGRMGLVEQQSETGLYDLGSFALELGLSAVARLEPVTLAAPVMNELCAEIRQTVALAVWGNHGPTIVRWMGTDTPVSASLRVGAVMPLTRSATGQAFLSFLSPETTASLLRRELAENVRMGLTPASREEVEQLTTQIQRRGLARTNDFIPGIGGIAAPVFDHSGSMVLAVVALGYSKPFDAAIETISAALIRTARQLSKRFGAPEHLSE